MYTQEQTRTNMGTRLSPYDMRSETTRDEWICSSTGTGTGTDTDTDTGTQTRTRSRKHLCVDISGVVKSKKLKTNSKKLKTNSKKLKTNSKKQTTARSDNSIITTTDAVVSIIPMPIYLLIPDYPPHNSNGNGNGNGDGNCISCGEPANVFCDCHCCDTCDEDIDPAFGFCLTHKCHGKPMLFENHIPYYGEPANVFCDYHRCDLCGENIDPEFGLCMTRNCHGIPTVVREEHPHPLPSYGESANVFCDLSLL